MNALDTAMNALFADANLTEAALYMPQHGVSKKVSVITHKPDAFVSVGDAFIATPTIVLDVLVADCPDLAPGDKFLIGGTLYVVQGESKRDSSRLVYRVDLVILA